MQARIENRPLKWRKIMMSNAAVAVIAFPVGLGVARLYRSGALGELGASEFIAAVTGLTYLLMGIAIGIGAIVPGAGSRYLNFEDEEELREQRRQLTLAAPAILAMAAALFVLALAGSGGIVGPQAALATVLALWLVASVFTLVLWREMDELGRTVSRESGNITYYLLFMVGGGWAMLAWLGFMPGPSPLDWITMLHALPLGAAFIAAGRKGMLMQR